MSDTLRNIIILLCIVLLGVLGWYIFDQNRQLQLQTTTITGVSLQIEIQRFIEKQSELRQLSMDTDLFHDPVFQSLESITVPIPTFPTGRDNLFQSPF